MKKYSFLILVFCAAFLTQCKKEPKRLNTEEALEEFKQVAGTWQMQPNLSAFEKWEIIEKGMLGRSFAVSEGDTIISSVYFFENKNDTIQLEVQPINDDGVGEPITYKLTSATPNSFTFENQGHNFPKVITYRINNDDDIEVLLQGQIEGLQQEADYLLKKVPE